jgi:hypothetical protein
MMYGENLLLTGDVGSEVWQNKEAGVLYCQDTLQIPCRISLHLNTERNKGADVLTSFLDVVMSDWTLRGRSRS